MHQTGGKGGYTKCYVYLPVTTKVYPIVGGSAESTGVTHQLPGGYNGGGMTAAHEPSCRVGMGGGMTHVSYTRNVASNTGGYWSETGTIAIAGGGGGGSSKRPGGAGGGYAAGDGDWPRSSDAMSHKCVKRYPNGANQSYGFRKGVGQSTFNSGGGGGGYFGGFTSGCTYICPDRNCYISGGGGSGHIYAEGQQTSYTPNNLCLIGTAGNVPRHPNGAQSGFVRIVLVQRQ